MRRARYLSRLFRCTQPSQRPTNRDNWNLSQKHGQTVFHCSMHCCKGPDPIVHACDKDGRFPLAMFNQRRLPSPMRVYPEDDSALSTVDITWRLYGLVLAVRYPSRIFQLKAYLSALLRLRQSITSSLRSCAFLSTKLSRKNVELPGSQERQEPQELWEHPGQSSFPRSWVRTSCDGAADSRGKKRSWYPASHSLDPTAGEFHGFAIHGTRRA